MEITLQKKIRSAGGNIDRGFLVVARQTEANDCSADLGEGGTQFKVTRAEGSLFLAF